MVFSNNHFASGQPRWAFSLDETRALAVELGYMPIIPPKSNRKNSWDYDKELYTQMKLCVYRKIAAPLFPWKGQIFTTALYIPGVL